MFRGSLILAAVAMSALSAAACSRFDDYRGRQPRSSTGLGPDPGDAEGMPHTSAVRQGDAQEMPSISADSSSDASTVDAPVMVAPPGTVTFDRLEDYFAFSFRTPEPFAFGPGTWAYVPAPDGHLVQSAYVRGGIQDNYTGTDAIYEPSTFGDTVVSVRTWSTDFGYAGLIARQVDENHYYRFRIKAETTTTPVARIEKIDGRMVTLLASSDTPASFESPGTVLRFEVVGNTLTAYAGGVLVAAATDTSFASGKVGLTCLIHSDVHFDDFTVHHILPTIM